MGRLSKAGELRYKRDARPTDYLFKVESFSILASAKGDSYETEVFEAAGHKWRLSLYPNGNDDDDGADNISLYAVIEETDKLRCPWYLYVDLKLFVFDQINDTYLVIQDDPSKGMKRFHEMKNQWGFSQLLTLDEFNDARNGYLVKDCCVFGVELFVIRPSCKSETLSMVKNPHVNNLLTKFKWEIEGFSKLDEKPIYSKPLCWRRSWEMYICPKGEGDAKGNSLSLFLMLLDADKLPVKKKVWVEFKLRALDQRRGNHHERTASTWFTSSAITWGFGKFLPLEVSKGFVFNDYLTVEAEFVVISVSKIVE